MIRIGASLMAGLVVGLACGSACKLWVAGRPIVQSIVAMASSWFLASILASILWLRNPPESTDITAVSFGVLESAITTGVVAILATVLHFTSEWIGGHGVIVTWRPVILGAIGGLCGAASFIQELDMIRPLR